MRTQILTLCVRYAAASFTLACLAIPWVIPLTEARESIVVTASIVGAMVYVATFMEEKP